MKTEPGKTYDLTIESLAPAAGSDWFIARLAQVHPVAFVGQSTLSVSDGFLRSRVRLKWVGAEPGGFVEGAVILPDQPMPDIGRPFNAQIVDVQEAPDGEAAQAQPTSTTILEIGAAVALLGYVAWSAHKIKTKMARKKARR